MSQPAWKSGATAAQEVDTFTPASVTTGDVNKLIAVDESGTLIASASFTVGGTQTATAVVTGLSASWAGNSTLVAIATFSGSATAILTAATAGVPFHVSATCTGSGTLTRAATTPNAGPNDWNTAANWTTGAVPVNSDTVTIDGRGGSASANAILYGLDQSAVTVTLINHYKSAPPVGTSSFALKIGATTANWGLPDNDGASRSGQIVNVNYGTVANTTNVWDSPNTGTGGLAPVLIAGNEATNVLNQYGGIVGYGTFTTGATGTIATINAVSGILTTGTAVDITACVVSRARVTLGKGGTSLTVTSNGGDTTLNGTTKIGTITLNGGTVHNNIRLSGDDVTAVTMNGGTLDLSNAAAAINAGTLAIKKGGTVRVASASQFTATATTFDVTNGVNFQMLVAA